MDQEEAAWKVASWFWRNRDGVLQKLSEIFAWIKRDRKFNDDDRGILILGPGGVGKTTVAKLFAGAYDLLLDAPTEYEESLNIERFQLADDSEIEVVVPPGQAHRRETTWSELQSNIAAGTFRGIIYLSAYGYHSLGEISYKSHRLYHGNKKTFLNEYLDDRRNEELRVLRQLVPYLKTNSSRLWLFSIVTKQDLWWPKRNEVQEHYEHGEFAQIIANVLRHRGAHQFHHELAFASLVINNFKTGREENLLKNAGGYDQQLQVNSLRRLFEILDALKNWESTP